MNYRELDSFSCFKKFNLSCCENKLINLNQTTLFVCINLCLCGLPYYNPFLGTPLLIPWWGLLLSLDLAPRCGPLWAPAVLPNQAFIISRAAQFAINVSG